jgi:predicted ATPase
MRPDGFADAVPGASASIRSSGIASIRPVISSIRLQNYRNHKDTEIEFGELTALVGPNSSGKSNVLEAIRCFTQLDEKLSFGSVFQGSKAPEVVVRHGEPSFTLQIEGERPVNWYMRIRCNVERAPSSEESVSGSLPQLSGEGKIGREEIESISFPAPVFRRSGGNLRNYLAGAIYLKSVFQNLSDPSAPQEIPPTLRENGTGLASVISYLMTTEPDRFNRLVRQLREIVPEVEGLRTRPKVPKGKNGNENEAGRLDELLYDMRGGEGIPAHSVSEGTLVATGLLAAVIGNEEREPHLLMIDDLERGLHPKAQRELVGVLRRILDQRPDLQIVFTTHSPYIVDELAPEETWLLNTDEEGVAHTRRLSEHPDAEKSLQVLTTGEFWSAEGEDWVVDDGASDEAAAQPSAE